jgi:uncharacterized protein
MSTVNRYRKFSEYLQSRFGGPVRKVSLDAGFSCPNRDGTLSLSGCVFCAPRSFSPAAGARISIGEQLRRGIERNRTRGAAGCMAYFQPYSNTYAQPGTLRAAYDTIRRFPEVKALAIGTRPDCLEGAVLDLIAEYTREYEVWLELGLQSVHNATLARLNRGHNAEAFFRAAERIRRFPDIKICAHVILGLPGEDEAMEAQTAGALTRQRADGVKLHPLYVVKGTALAQDFYAGRFQPLEQAEYVRRAVSFLERLPSETVIQRLTADCPAELLIGPQWLSEKRAVLHAIDERLEAGNTRQGALAAD